MKHFISIIYLLTANLTMGIALFFFFNDGVTENITPIKFKSMVTQSIVTSILITIYFIYLDFRQNYGKQDQLINGEKLTTTTDRSYWFRIIQSLLFSFPFFVALRSVEFFVFKRGISENMTPTDFYKISYHSLYACILFTLLIAYTDYQKRKKNNVVQVNL